MPSEDKEKIRIAEEKIREELKEKTVEINQANIQSNNFSDTKDEKNLDNDVQNFKKTKNKTIEIKLNLP